MNRRFLLLMFFLLVLGALAAASAQPAHSYLSFNLGPLPPSLDLRNMVRRHVVELACRQLEIAGQSRARAFAGTGWPAWRERVRAVIKAEMGDWPTDTSAAEMNIRTISRHELEGCDIENVLFESFPGWDVNATVFLPKKERFPPPWPGIVVPVGHSSKTRVNYQIPAQVFASCGYAAVLFDPPGMAGEKQPGNDHFKDGVRCYLTGTSSNRYFIFDAIRCLDYLATRPDIDSRSGFGMTGVSGGGTTTMFAALLDDRIAAIGPACCAMPSSRHPVLDVYAPCTETLPFAHFKSGIDDVDLLCAAIPVPLLFMYGEKDEVFKLEFSRDVSAQVHKAYRNAAIADQFAEFADTCGHAYSISMAIRFISWMDKWIRKAPALHPLQPASSQYRMLPDSMLFCHPRPDGNMYTINRALALQLKEGRRINEISESVKKVVDLAGNIRPASMREGKPFQVWAHELKELVIVPEKGIELPATLMMPFVKTEKNGAVLFFDDRGRWTELRQNGLLAELTHFLQMDQKHASVMTVDLRGWGDTQAADLPYEIAAWGHSSRWISYVSAAVGDHILAMRIKDGLAALKALRTIQAVDSAKIVVAGDGMGGVVAQHVAVLDGKVAGCVAINSLATFESLAVSEKYAWSHDAFLPNVLEYYDLPDLAAWLNKPVMLLNPLDAEKKGLALEAMVKIYSAAKERNPRLQIVQTERIVSKLKPWVESLIY